MTISIQSRPSAKDASASRCPLCRDGLHLAELRAGDCGHCPECETRYHRECYAEFGGCSTLGCRAYRQPLKSPSAQPLAAAQPNSLADWEAKRGPLPTRVPWLKLAQAFGAQAALASFVACVALDWTTGFYLAFFLIIGLGLTAVDDWSM